MKQITKFRKVLQKKLKLDPIGLSLGILSVLLGVTSLIQPISYSLFSTDSTAVYGQQNPQTMYVVGFVFLIIAIASFAYTFMRRK